MLRNLKVLFQRWFFSGRWRSDSGEVFAKRRWELFGVFAALLIWGATCFFLRSYWTSHYSSRVATEAKRSSDRLYNLFQSSFYFNYDDQFKPGVEDFLRANPSLRRILIISGSG